MFPSSNRVKLNRVALKDVAGVNLAPRRRRLPKPQNKLTADSKKQDSASGLESERDSASVHSSSEPGRALFTRRMGPESATGTPSNTWEAESEERCAQTHVVKRRSYVPPCRRDDMEDKQDGPNTRGKYRQSKPNTRSRSRLERLRKLCSLRLRCRVCADSDHVLLEEIYRGVKQSEARGRHTLTLGPVSRSDSLTCFSQSVRDRCRDGQSSVKSAACAPGLVRTGPPSVPTRLSNSDGDSDQQVYLRRSVGASHCDLCGDCNNISPWWKTVGMQAPKNSNSGSEPPAAKFKIKNENTRTKTSKKVIVWINQYPKVTLCDIANKCDVCCYNCGYVLPDFLKTNVVHCFKQDMRAGFRFGPGCLGDGKHKSGQRSLIKKNSACCPSVHCKKSICQSLTENQKHSDEGTDVKTLSSRTTCHIHQSLTSEDCVSCSASRLLGKRTNKGECNTGMWDRGAEEDHGPVCDLSGAGICRNKRKKLGNSAGCSRTFGSDSFINKKPCGQRGTLRKNIGPQVASELFCHENEADTDEPESFSCQRVRPYYRKINFSCARTYMSWPFLNSGLTPTAHKATTACSAQSVDPSARYNSDSLPVNQNQAGSSSNRVKDMLSNAPTEKQEEGRASILAERNLKRSSNMFSYPDRKHTESPASLPSAIASFSTPGQHGKKPDTPSESSLLINGPEIDSSMSTPSPSALGLSDWESATTMSPVSSLFTLGGSNSLSATPSSLPPSSYLLKKVKEVDLETVEKTMFYCEETQKTSCIFPSSAPPLNSDSCHSCESSLLLHQEDDKSDEELLNSRSPPKLEPYYNTSQFKQDLALDCTKESSQLCDNLKDYCVESGSDEFMLPPVLSPVTSPQGSFWRRTFSHQSSVYSDEEKEEEINMMLACHMPQVGNGNIESSKDYLQHHTEGLEGVSTSFRTLTDSTQRESQSSPFNSEGVDNSSENGVDRNEDVVDNKEEESQDETDNEDDVEQGNTSSEPVPVNPQVKTALSSVVLMEPCSSPSSEEIDGAGFSDEGQQHSGSENGSSSSEIAGSEREKTKAEAAGDCQPRILDEFTAYEQDILLVDVIQDDPALFDNLPKQSLLKLGPTKVTEAPKSRPPAVVKMLSSRMNRASPEFKQRLTPVIGDFHCNSPDIKEESVSRPWRPQCSTTPTETQNNTRPAANKLTKNVGQSDTSNNHVNGGRERSQPIQTVSSSHTLQHIPPLRSLGTGSWMTTSANITDFIRKKSNAYCRQYFSESLSCGFKMCRFQHLPVEGDEKFCIETVARFAKNSMCLQKAGAVFTGYYQNNPPGVYFSMPVLLTLLWALLKACMLSDVFSVLRVSLAHNIVPGHEFLLALFNFVREKGLMGSVPELMQLTFKMASAGLELSLDCLDCVKNAPVFQQSVHADSPVSVSGKHNAPFLEYLNLAHAIVEIELCIKQEDWKRMGEAFRYICQSSQHSNQVERISGRILIALLSESKDKLSLPFAAFAENVCQNDNEDTMLNSFVGRIGVSLMLRYHKTHQWAKGRRVVEMLSMSKVNYATLKGLFGNEDGASRCYLVTVATELCLLSGSVEGALHTLRENKWFLSSSSWPCVPADLEGRTRVLIRLAEKTSHRDTLEVLCNLPGIKEPNDLVDLPRYSPLFNSHLQVCVDRQILPVASDTVDFMLSKNLAVNDEVLQILLHKLGKQNLWLRAREVFRHSLSTGYYSGVSAPPGSMSLIVPCGLGEVQLALTFEMFITVNANVILQLPESSASSLSITLKRTQSGESEYLSAGSRLLSAACIPQPKLIVHYIAVNSSREQVFTVDISSARRWLRHNHLWANEVWTKVYVPQVPGTT